MTGKRQTPPLSAGILALALAGSAWAAAGTAWEREMAESRRPEMPPETARAAWRNSRGMMELPAATFRAACTAVANGVLPGGDAGLPEDASWETAYATQEERVEVAEFRDGAGRTNRMAVYEQLGNKFPYYWTVEGGSAEELSSTAEDVWEAEGVLERSGTEMTELGVEVLPPYERFRFRVLDDAPERDWIRPCRYVFEDADGSGVTVLWKKMPPRMRNRSTGEKIPWKGGSESIEGVGGAGLTAAMEGVAEWRQGLLREEKASGEGLNTNAGMGGKTYFVLFSGGGDPEYNGIRFWCDTAMLYSTLRLKYGIPKERIRTFVSDGLDPAPDANLDGKRSNVYVNSPQDLDGDGIADIDGAATAEALHGCLAGLAGTLRPDDCLWVFITSHGASIGEAAANNTSAKAWGWSKSGMDVFTDAEFARWTAGIRCPVAVALEPCFSGGFADDLLCQADRAVATSASNFESSFGFVGGGVWTDGNGKTGKRGTPGKTWAANSWAQEFASALRGVRPANLDEAAFPWQDGAKAVPADLNGDGCVSFREAAEWARRNDRNACKKTSHAWAGTDACLQVCGRVRPNTVEHPQYGESRRGLGDELFVGKKRPAASGVYGVRGNGSTEKAAGKAMESWERGMAERRPGMPSLRTRNEWKASHGARDRTPNAMRRACIGVANGALEASGSILPDSAEWQTVFSSEEERIELAEFRDDAGHANRLAVYEQVGNRVPYYWIVEGSGADADAVAGTAGATWEVEGLLERDDIQMAELGTEVVPPYARFRFRFLDDQPDENWVRPCRYLFEDADGSGFTVLWKKMPPRMRHRSSGEEIHWKGASIPDVPEEKVVAPRGNAVSVSNVAGIREESREGARGGDNADGGRTFFLLFSGGGDVNGNDISMWSTTAMMYSTLTKTCQVPKERIQVFMSDGKNSAEDANLAGALRIRGKQIVLPVDSPRDLDGDGAEDVDGAATPGELERSLAGFAQSLTAGDSLWIFIGSHGCYRGVKPGPEFKDSLFLGWSDGFSESIITDEDFALWTAPIRCPVAIAMYPCFSGGFIDDVTDQPNRAITTAPHHYESALGRFGTGCWSDGNLLDGKLGTPGKTPACCHWAAEFISALRHAKPANLDAIAFPWQNGAPVDADANRDGRVSFWEAAMWARQHDPKACPECKGTSRTCANMGHEHPQYAESRQGLGDTLFIQRIVANREALECHSTPSVLPIPKAAFKTNIWTGN